MAGMLGGGFAKINNEGLAWHQDGDCHYLFRPSTGEVLGEVVPTLYLDPFVVGPTVFIARYFGGLRLTEHKYVGLDAAKAALLKLI